LKKSDSGFKQLPVPVSRPQTIACPRFPPVLQKKVARPKLGERDFLPTPIRIQIIP
jgi:hypothetical protein